MGSEEENREEGELSEEGELPDDEPAEELPAKVRSSSWQHPHQLLLRTLASTPCEHDACACDAGGSTTC
jgi:hypothetical protein